MTMVSTKSVFMRNSRSPAKPIKFTSRSAIWRMEVNIAPAGQPFGEQMYYRRK
jgi:hypothetical protein